MNFGGCLVRISLTNFTVETAALSLLEAKEKKESQLGQVLTYHICQWWSSVPGPIHCIYSANLAAEAKCLEKVMWPLCIFNDTLCHEDMRGRWRRNSSIILNHFTR
jgi:hypothetical protein